MSHLATVAIFILQISSHYIAVQGQPSTSSSLYIPGFDPQPISADIVGVGSDGRTTWALHKGTPHPTDTASYADFRGTATLVEGPEDAFLTYADSNARFTIGAGCSFLEDSLAVCTIAAQGSTATQTEVVTRIPIQGGTTLISSNSTSRILASSTLASSTRRTETSYPAPNTSRTPTMTGPLPTSSGSSASLAAHPKGLAVYLHAFLAVLIISWWHII